MTGMGSDAPPFTVAVECYAGHRGEETPRRFRLAGTSIEIAGVIDRWLAPDHRYFKVEDGRGGLYILRNDVRSGIWELTLFQRAEPFHGSSRPES